MFTPSHSIEVRVAYGDVAPVADAVFLAPEYQNRTIADPRPVNLLSGEVYYRLSLRSVEIGLSGYVTTTRGESDVRHYYDDLAGEFSNMELSAIDKLYVGAELGVTVRLTDRWSLRGAAAFSDNTYLSDPAADIYADRDNRPVAVGATAYLKGYKLGGSPQTVASGELQLFGPAHVDGCRVGQLRRAQLHLHQSRAAHAPVLDYATSPEALQEMTSQEQFGDATNRQPFSEQDVPSRQSLPHAQRVGQQPRQPSPNRLQRV